MIQLWVIVVIALTGCDRQNDNFDKYIRNGERIYIGKLDSVTVLSGINKFKVLAYTSDPRIEQMSIYWSDRGDSVNIPVPKHEADEPISVVVDKGEMPLQEQNYVLEFVNFDCYGNKSITVEGIIEVYGDYYLSQLYNLRTNCELDKAANKLTIQFYPRRINSEQEVYIIYRNKDNGWTRVRYTRNEIDNDLAGELVLDSSVLSENTEDCEVYLQTVFVPEEGCIDTVYMPKRVLTSKIKVANLEDSEEVQRILQDECLKIFPMMAE